MAIIEQISTLVQDAVEDALGGDSTLSSARETTDLVSMGMQIDSANAYEGFYKSLVNRLVKTVYAVRMYSAKKRGILRDETEWGAFKQKVHYQLAGAVDNPAFGVATESEGVISYTQHSPYDVESTLQIKALIFGGQGTWSIEVIRPIAQIKTAFTGAAEMVAFIDGIYAYIENSLQLELEAVERLAADTGMGYTIKKGKAINLLTEYNTNVAAEGETLTAAKALYSLEFLRYAAMRITETVKYMSEMTVLYSAEGMPKFTPQDRLVVEVLEKFADQSAFYLQSDTYHNELVSLPRYNPISFWQSPGAAFAFADTSEISIQHDDFVIDSEDPDDTGTCTQSGIIAFLHDEDYVAANFGERYAWEEVNKRDRLVIHGEQARKGYAVDPNENSIVFFIADVEQADSGEEESGS